MAQLGVSSTATESDMELGLGFPGGSSLIHCADSWGAISWVLSLGAITVAPVVLSAKVSVPSSCLASKVSRKGGDKRQNPSTSPTHLHRPVSTRKGEGGAGSQAWHH